MSEMLCQEELWVEKMANDTCRLQVQYNTKKNIPHKQNILECRHFQGPMPTDDTTNKHTGGQFANCSYWKRYMFV